ncbi:CaiB/BaiF CoA transferase family protein [Jatrophihabitans sp. DSM 45814]
MKGIEGLVVVEAAEGIGGPYCGQVLADLGAEVIKIEPPGGDWARTLGPPFVDGVSPTYLSSNRGKRGTAVDLRTDSGARFVRDLVARADVFIAGYRPGALEQRGLGPDDLIAGNPRLVHCSLSGFGNRGPKRERPGSDTILQGYSGIMSITGNEELGPARVGTPIADTAAGIYCALAVMTMLVRRDATGVGGRCDTSLLETLIHLQGVSFAGLFAGDQPVRLGSRSSLAAVPAEAVATYDGWITLSCHSPRQWSKLCAALEHPEWEHESGMATNADRVAGHDQVMSRISRVLADRTTADWMRIFTREGVNADVINTLEMVSADPHVAALGIFGGPVDSPTHVGLPLTFEGETTSSPTGRAPALGEHTAEVARELGYETTTIAELFAAGVLHGDDRLLRSGSVAARAQSK